MHYFGCKFSKTFRGLYPLTPIAGGGDPLPASSPSTFGRARGPPPAPRSKTKKLEPHPKFFSGYALDNKYYRRSRCGMSDVAFRTARQLVGFLVIIRLDWHIEIAIHTSSPSLRSGARPTPPVIF